MENIMSKKYVKVSHLALSVGLFTASFSGSALAAGELHLYNWSNYFPPSLLELYEKETGTKVTIDSYASEDDLLAKLQAGGGGYDVIFPGASTLGVMVEKGMLANAGINKMENFNNLLAPFQTIAGDENREYSAPYMWGTTGFTYDPASVPGNSLEESWKEVFEPRAELKGKIAMLNEMIDVWNSAAYYKGIDKCTEDPAEAQQILDLLLAQKPDVKLYSSEGTIDRMIAGEVPLHMQWNGAAHRVKAKKPDVVYVYPKEGTSFWVDNMAIPKDSPNIDEAKAFINWMMRPDIAAEASNYTGYSNAVKGSGEFLKEELKADPAVNTPES